MKKKDLTDVWTASKNALSKFNNYEDQAGKKDISKATKARDELQKAVDAAAVELDKKREALLSAMGVK